MFARGTLDDCEQLRIEAWFEDLDGGVWKRPADSGSAQCRGVAAAGSTSASARAKAPAAIVAMCGEELPEAPLGVRAGEGGAGKDIIVARSLSIDKPRVTLGRALRPSAHRLRRQARDRATLESRNSP